MHVHSPVNQHPQRERRVGVLEAHRLRGVDAAALMVGSRQPGVNPKERCSLDLLGTWSSRELNGGKH